jgi:hypothetical protein
MSLRVRITQARGGGVMGSTWMKKSVLTVLAISLVWLPGLAVAQGADLDFPMDKMERCMAEFGPQAKLSRVEGGEWRCVGSRGTAEIGSGFGALIAIGLIWSAVPMVIGGVVASSRGESVGLALILTLLLGWIGLLIVVVLMNRTAQSAKVDVTSGASTGGSIVDRLSQLDDLRERGLINDEEYATRRQEILAET